MSGKTLGLHDIDIGRDDLLASGVTQTDGSHALELKAKRNDAFDNTAEIHAKFEGDSDHKSSVSKQYVIMIKNKK